MVLIITSTDNDMHVSPETWEAMLPPPEADCKELNIIISCLNNQHVLRVM